MAEEEASGQSNQGASWVILFPLLLLEKTLSIVVTRLVEYAFMATNGYIGEAWSGKHCPWSQC